MRDDELAHYGVLGMRWGVRKDRQSRSSGKTKRRAPSEQQIEKSRRRVGVNQRRTLSEEELKKRIERLELEKRYKDLSDNDVNRGRKVVSSILADVGKTIARNAAVGAGAYAIKVALTRQFDIKEFARYVAPNPHAKKK